MESKKEKKKEEKDKKKEKDKDKKEKKEKKDKEKKKDKDKGEKSLFSTIGEWVDNLTDSNNNNNVPPTHIPTSVSAQSTAEANAVLLNPSSVENHKKAMDFWVTNTSTTNGTTTTTTTTNSNNIPSIVTTVISTPSSNNVSNSNNNNVSSTNNKTTNNNSSNVSNKDNVKLNISSLESGNNAGKSDKDITSETSPKNRKDKDSKDKQQTTTTTDSSPINETPADENRKKLVEGFMQSLQSFSEAIKVVLDVFYQPLKKNDILSQEEIKGIFSVIESISSFKQTILEDLKKYLNNWNSTTQASLYSTFVQFVGYLKLYKVYGLQYNYSLSGLCLLMFDNSRFENFIKNAENKLVNDHKYTLQPIVQCSSSSACVKPVSLAEILGTQYDQSKIDAAAANNSGNSITFPSIQLRRTGNANSFIGTGNSGVGNSGSSALGSSVTGKFTQEYSYSNLASLLILPVHFLARFHQFFKSLIDSIAVLHPDYKPYNQLYKQITQVVKEVVNESVNINKVISISKSIKSPTIGLFNSSDIVVNRKFLKEGILIEQFNNQRVSYYTFLFSDLILFTEKIEDSSSVTSNTLMAYEGSFYTLKKLERIAVIQVDDPELGFEYRKGFQIKTKESSIFYMTSSEKEKSNWFQVLSQATLKASSSGNSGGSTNGIYGGSATNRSSNNLIVSEDIFGNGDDGPDEFVDPKDIAIFCKMITSGQRPRVELNSSMLKISDPKPLFSALASTHFVNHLIFSPSTMNDKYMQMTLGMMSLNKSITHLQLSQNSINDSCAVALGDMLRYNHSLIQMDLCENTIGDKGLISLIDGILSHPSITVVMLTQNQITDVGAKHIVKLLKFNQTLNALFLEDNNISSSVAGEIIDQWISCHSTVLTRITLPSIPSDYNERVKTKAISVTNRLDKKKKQLSVSQATSGKLNNSNNNSNSTSSNALLSNNNKGLLDLGSYDYPEISVALLNKLNMLSLDSRRIADIRELYLDHNCISSVPVNVLKELKNLQLLDLSNNQLSSIPSEISELKELRTLNVSHNNLSSLPNEIGQLVKLVHLDISFNFIETINVNSLSLLTELKVLMMQRNYFNRLPISIFQKLVHLESFSINGSPCFHPIKQRVYESIAIKSSKLDLSDSGLAYLPIEIGSISTLTELDLSNNRIKDLPPQIGKLSSLTTLNLSNNAIESLPWQLSQLTNLKLLTITGNPISFDMTGSGSGSSGSSKFSIPDILTGDDLNGLLKYLKLASTKEKPCMRIKLMLVGQENVGKTSIAKCLKKEIIPVGKKLRQTIGLGTKKSKTPTLGETSVDFNSPQGINPLNTSLNISTDGINMDDWRPPSEDQSPAVTFSIWDFAGQEVYYSTHQFFISSRSVYIVVFDMSVYNPDETSRVPYWLQCIEAFGGDSSVILVGTHLDDLPSGVDVNQITQDIHNKYFTKFPNLKLFLPVSCKSGKNINKLQNHIVKLGKAEKKLGDVYSRSYFQLESLILSEREMNTPPIITFSEFSEMAIACGIPVASVGHAADFLKELGIIVYFDDPKSGLDQFIFIDPPWLTRLMATIITSKPNFVQSGVLDQSNLHQIWKPPDFPQHLHHVLLAILQKFEIVHPLPDPKATTNSNSGNNNNNLSNVVKKPVLNRSGSTITSNSFINSQQATANSGGTTSLLNVSRFGNGSISKGSSLNLIKKLNEQSNSGSGNNNSLTSSNNSLSDSITLIPKSSTKHLVPILLSSDRPNSIEKVYDTLIKNHQSSPWLERIYQFEFLPVGFFSKLMIRTMHFTTVKEYWKNGLLVERDDSQCLIESISQFNQINFKAWGKNQSNLLRFIIETAEVLISGWYKLQFHFLVPCNCPSCITILSLNNGSGKDCNSNGGNSGGKEISLSNSSGSIPNNNTGLSHANSSSSISNSSTPSVTSPPLSNNGNGNIDTASSTVETTQSSDVLELDFSDYYDGESVSPGGTLKSKRKKNPSKFLTLYRTGNGKATSSSGKSNPAPAIGSGTANSSSSSLSTNSGGNGGQSSVTSTSSSSSSNGGQSMKNIDLSRISSMINQQLSFGPSFKSQDLRTMFLYEDIERTFLSKKFEMYCRDESNVVRLDTLVPELMMSDIGQNFTLEYKDLEIIEKVGEGGFGIVYKGKLRGQLVAVKQITISGNHQAAAEEIYREFRREVWLSNTLTHPSIVSLKGYCLDPCCIVMEYISNGTLYSFLRKSTESSTTSAPITIPWSLKLKIAINIADALKHMHGFTPKICHRDLKSPNILMLSDMSANVVCKVSDFGETRAVVTSALGRDKLSNPIWLSPEIMRGEEYTEKADVYSYGIVLWEILTGLLPFDEFPVAHSSFMYQLEDEITNGLRPTIPTQPSSVNPDYVTLITDCWQNDPLKRPTFPEIHNRLILMSNVIGGNNGGSGSIKTTSPITNRPKASTIFGNASSSNSTTVSPVAQPQPPLVRKLTQNFTPTTSANSSPVAPIVTLPSAISTPKPQQPTQPVALKISQKPLLVSTHKPPAASTTSSTITPTPIVKQTTPAPSPVSILKPPTTPAPVLKQTTTTSPTGTPTPTPVPVSVLKPPRSLPQKPTTTPTVTPPITHIPTTSTSTPTSPPIPTSLSTNSLRPSKPLPTPTPSPTSLSATNSPNNTSPNHTSPTNTSPNTTSPSSSTIKFSSVSSVAKPIGQSSTLPSSSKLSNGNTTNVSNSNVSVSGSSSTPNTTVTSPSNSFLLRPTGNVAKKLPAIPTNNK